MGELSLFHLRNNIVTNTADVTVALNDKVSKTDLATTTAPGLMTAADKVKLNSITAGAAPYTHPSTHAPSIISQDANNRFVTDTEKTNWNAKLTAANGSATGTLTTQNIAMTTGYTLKHGTYTIIDATGNVWRAVYNDLAEWFERGSEELLVPGDVLVWNGQGVEKAKIAGDKRAVGVYSDSYGICLGGENLPDMKANLEKFVPVGLAGRVNVKVTGDIEIGDYIISSNIPGVAQKADGLQPGIIGKALENHYGKEITSIKMLIMNI